MTHPPEHLRNVKRAAQAAWVARHRLHAAIIDAYNNRGDSTVDDIAEAAGLSRARIYQIVNEGRD